MKIILTTLALLALTITASAAGNKEAVTINSADGLVLNAPAINFPADQLKIGGVTVTLPAGDLVGTGVVYNDPPWISGLGWTKINDRPVTVISGKTVTFNNTLSFSGPDGASYTLPAAGTLANLNSAQIFTGAQTFSNSTAFNKPVTLTISTFLGNGLNISAMNANYEDIAFQVNTLECQLGITKQDFFVQAKNVYIHDKNDIARITLNNGTTNLLANTLSVTATSTNWNGGKIGNLGNGTATGDAVNKGQLDAALVDLPAGSLASGNYRLKQTTTSGSVAGGALQRWLTTGPVPDAAGLGAIDLQADRDSTWQTAKGTNSSILGGKQNRIGTGADHTVISGGYVNSILSVGDDYATIGGGLGNTISGDSQSATIAGGQSNLLEHAPTSTIGGGLGNNIQNHNFATIPGGQNAVAHWDSEMTWSANNNYGKSAGSSELCMYQFTDSSYPTPMYFAGGGSYFTCRENQAIFGEIFLVGHVRTGTQPTYHRYMFCMYRGAGGDAVHLDSWLDPNFSSTNVGTATLTTSANDLLIIVQGGEGVPTTWSARIMVTKVIGPDEPI